MAVYHAVSYCSCISGKPSVDTWDEAVQECSRQADFMTTMWILFITHIIDAVMTVFTFLYFTCCHEKILTMPQVNFLSSERKCSLCMRCCIGWAGIFTCGIFGGGKASVNGDYANFSLLMANYLNGNGILDVAASDIHVGLRMLGILRKRNKLEIYKSSIE